MMVGDPRVFAIETAVTSLAANEGQLALGFFVIHVAGKKYRRLRAGRDHAQLFLR